MAEDLVKAYKDTIHALDKIIELMEEDIKNLKKIRKNFERFIPIVENY
jgi:hypothetical protein